jgi:hypothetical protein
LQIGNVQNNTSVSKNTDRGGGGAGSLSHTLAQAHLNEPKLASSSSITEWDL